METETEPLLRSLVEKWTSHMAWRADFRQWQHRRLWQERYQQEHLRQLEWASGGELARQKVLDLGCGMGGLSVALALLGVKVLALDPNPEYLQITRLRGLRYGLCVTEVQALGEFLPFRDSSFDAVVAFDVLEHCARPRQLLEEVYRVLRDGGWALVTVTNRYAFRDPHYHMPFLNWLPRKIGEHLVRLRPKHGYSARDRQALGAMHYFGWREFVSLSRSCGFELRAFDVRIRSSRARAALGDVAEALGIYVPLYHLYRLLFRGTWTFKLTKPERPCR